jgi:hypothetical protein
MVWKKEDQLLWVGTTKVARDERIRLTDTSIEIVNVRPGDSGDYSCSLNTEQKMNLTVTLDILGKRKGLPINKRRVRPLKRTAQAANFRPRGRWRRKQRAALTFLTSLISFARLAYAEPAKVRRFPEDGRVLARKGESLKLECLGEGNPTPIITWSRSQVSD